MQVLINLLVDRLRTKGKRSLMGKYTLKLDPEDSAIFMEDLAAQMNIEEEEQDDDDSDAEEEGSDTEVDEQD